MYFRHLLSSSIPTYKETDIIFILTSGAKRVYVIGQLVFTAGMAIMAAARHKVAVVLLSPTAGIMYATLFTMPYLLVAHYHTSGLVRHLPVASRTDIVLSALCGGRAG